MNPIDALHTFTRVAELASFTQAAAPDEGRRLYEHLVEQARRLHPEVATGIFAADMKVHLVNDGPITLVLEVG